MVVVQENEQAIIDAFLNGSDSVGDRSIADLVALCDKRIRTLTQHSNEDAIRFAESLLSRCRKLGDKPMLIAQRSAGWAYLVAGKYRKSLQCYLAARKLASKQPLVRARIDRTLIDVYMYLGEPSKASDCASSARTAFRKLSAADDLARTDVNYANVLHRQDCHRKAYKLYHRAAEHFKERGDELSLALCWYNEGNTLVQLFDFDRAFTVYSEARKIFAIKGHALHAIGCLYGLAWLSMLKGDFHVALRDLSECENFYREGGQSRELVLCQLDRAECYLGLNLLSEAQQAAKDAAAGARKLGIRYEQAKAALFMARASAAMKQDREARTHLKTAGDLMRSESNHGFLGTIQFNQALLHDRGRSRAKALESARKSLRPAQLPLWEAICDIELAVENPSDNHAVRRLSKNRAVMAVPYLLAQYETIRGDQAARREDVDLAISHWNKAADTLDLVKAKLPPIEMRTSFAQSRRDPFRKLIAAESKQDAKRASIWVERSKTIGLWSTTDSKLTEHPDRQKIQKRMDELAQHVAAYSSVAAGSNGRRSARLAYRRPEFAQAREAIRRDLVSLYADGNAKISAENSIDELLETYSHKIPIVQFHVGEADIHAYVTHRGICRAHIYSGGTKLLDDIVARWRFFVECAPVNSKSHRQADLDDEHELIKRISDWLIAPLDLPTDTQQILVIPEGRLFCLPWLALQYDGEELYRRYEVILSPSMRHHANCAQRQVESNSARIFIGASQGLPWLQEEARLVQNRLARFDTEVLNPCRRGDWPDGCVDRIWHFAGHALLRFDNPFYSALLLDDGEIFAADFRLKNNLVDVVTLAACRTGQHTGFAGEEGGGLVRSLLEMGARSIVAGGWAVADQSTALWMDTFYATLSNQQSATAALQRSIEAVRAEFHSAYHWAAFSLYGAG